MKRLPVWPTARGWAFLCAAILSLLNAMVNPNLASFVFCAGCCSIILASFALSLFSLRKISLRREIGRDALRNSVVSLPLSVTNMGSLPRQALLAREFEGFTSLPCFDTVINPLLPGERRFVPRAPVARRRGRYQLSEISLLGGDPAGLFRRIRFFNIPEEVVIRPDKERITWMPIRIKGSIKGSSSGRNVGSAGFGHEFFGVREHRRSDGFRFINWKASAKHGRLMVKEFEEQDIPLVTIVLDCDIKSVGQDDLDSNFEKLVRFSASMADYLSGLYCQMAFVCGPAAEGGQPSVATGIAFSLGRCVIETLTDVKPTKTPLLDLLDASFRLQAPGSILYLLSMSAPDGLEQRLNTLSDEDVEVRWIMAPQELFPPHGCPPGTNPHMRETLQPQPLICAAKTRLASLLDYD